MRNAVDWRNVNERRLEHWNIEKRLAPSLRPGRTSWYVADKKFCSGVTADRFPDNDLDPLPIDLQAIFFRRNDRRQGCYIDDSFAAGNIERRQGHHIAQKCC